MTPLMSTYPRVVRSTVALLAAAMAAAVVLAVASLSRRAAGDGSNLGELAAITATVLLFVAVYRGVYNADGYQRGGRRTRRALGRAALALAVAALIFAGAWRGLGPDRGSNRTEFVAQWLWADGAAIHVIEVNHVQETPMYESARLKVTTPSDLEIAMIRVFDAPRHLVWAAHTRPELVKRWLLGPDGWTMPVCEIDLKVGGAYRYVWRNVDGREMGMGGVYRELAPPDRMVATERFDDPWYEGEAIVTTTFVERDGKTTLTTTMRLPTKESRDGVLKSGMEKGVEVSYDRLSEILSSMKGEGNMTARERKLKVTTPSDRELVMVRVFDAPRHLVWHAMSKPELIKRWLFLPDGWEMVTCEEDVRVGGKFLWVWNGPDGKQAMAMRGVYREVVPPERLVRTESFEMAPGQFLGEQLATMELDEAGGRTTLKMTALFPSKEARDGAIASGMEHGVAAGCDKLEALLTSGEVAASR